MTRRLLRRAPLVALLTLALGITLTLTPLEPRLAIQVYLLALGGIAIATFSAAASRSEHRRPSAFAAALRPRPERGRRPPELEQLERQVTLGVDSAADFHFRLRPLLVTIADAAVWRRHGVSLERAEGLLPPDVWDLVRPDRPPPVDRHAPGPPLERLDTFVAAIERMRA